MNILIPIRNVIIENLTERIMICSKYKNKYKQIH